MRTHYVPEHVNTIDGNSWPEGRLSYSYRLDQVRVIPEGKTSLTPLEHVLLDWLTK